MIVEAKGFKGIDQRVTLGRRNLLLGPCGSGKSEVVDALRFVFLGYVPRTGGKRLSDTAALMRGRIAECTVTLDDGRWVRRVLTVTDKGGYTSTVQCSWVTDDNEDAHAIAALSLVGRDRDDAAEALDPQGLFLLSPQQRIQRVQELIATAGVPEEVLQAVQRYTTQKLAGLTDDRMPADYRDAVPIIRPEHRAALKPIAPLLKEKLTDVGLQGALDWANGEKRAAALAVRNKGAARAELAERLKSEISGDAVAQALTSLTAERSAVEQELGAATERRAQYDARQRVVDKLGVASRDVLDTPPLSIDVADARRRLSEIETKLADLKEPTAPDYTEADAHRTRADEYQRQADALMGDESRFRARGELARIDAELAEARARVDALTTTPWGEVQDVTNVLNATAQAIKVQKHQATLLRCVARLDAVVRKHGSPDQLLALRGRVSVLEDERATAAAAVEAAAPAAAEHADLVAKARDAADAGRILRTHLTEQYTQAMATWRQAVKDLTAQRQAIQREIDADTVRRGDHEKRLAVLTAEVSTLELQLADMPEVALIDTVALKATLADLDKRKGTLDAISARRAEFEAIVAEIDQLTAQQIVYAALEWALQQTQRAEVAKSRGPFLDTLDRYLAAARRSERAYIDVAAGKCDIGWRRTDGSQVSIQGGMSGGEWQLFAAGLLAATQIRRAPEVRILIAEAGETDDLVCVQLLAGLFALSDELTAVIVLRQYDPPTLPLVGWDETRFSDNDVPTLSGWSFPSNGGQHSDPRPTD